MRDMGIVQGSAAQAKPLIVNIDTVYIHTDIRLIDAEFGLYEYHEIQYDKDEYIQMMAESLQEANQQIIDTQLALTEIYEKVMVDG